MNFNNIFAEEEKPKLLVDITDKHVKLQVSRLEIFSMFPVVGSQPKEIKFTQFTSSFTLEVGKLYKVNCLSSSSKRIMLLTEIHRDTIISGVIYTTFLDLGKKEKIEKSIGFYEKDVNNWKKNFLLFESLSWEYRPL